ncbi:MAG: hypothetical protein LBE97_00230 [Holosporales bacterium]|jgi:hypothetical protein|nr:hypothetical protein [Holosporales bacterium]
MLINGVKITFIICLTIIVSTILFISYNEYINRYAIIPTNDNGLYIFDKKSSVLNKCSEKGCELIETNLPEQMNFGFTNSFSPSKMLGADKSMREEIVTTEATPQKRNEEPTSPPKEKIKEKKSDKESNETTAKPDIKGKKAADESKETPEDEFIE